MADDIRRWSDELARDPASLVFLQLGDALRRQGQLDLALKIALRGLERHPHNADAHDLVARIAVDRGDFARARRRVGTPCSASSPDHAGALKGLGYLSFQQGRSTTPSATSRGAAATDEPSVASGARARCAARPETSRRSPTSRPIRRTSRRSRRTIRSRLFADLLVDDGQTALLLDANGYVLGGVYVDAEGTDVAQEVGAQLSGISDEVRRSTRHLDVGEWRSITFETQAAVVAMAPAPDGGLLVVAASRATPLGLLRRLLRPVRGAGRGVAPERRVRRGAPHERVPSRRCSRLSRASVACGRA